MAQYDVEWSVRLVSTTAAVPVGQCLVRNPATGYYYPATSANRASYGRATGIARSIGDASNLDLEMQLTGFALPTVTLLGSGTATWVRVSSAGFLERVTPSGSDDVVGWAETDGSVHLFFGIAPLGGFGSGGGGGFTPPTGTGPVKVSSGVLVGAATKIALNDTTNDVTGTLGVGSGGSGAATFSAGILKSPGGTGAFTTGTIALGSEVSGTLPLGNQAAPTGTGWVTVTSGAWDSSAKAFPTGSGMVTTTSGAINAAATAFPTGSAFWHSTGGVLDGATKKVDLTASADVTVPGSSGAAIVNNGSSALGAGTRVLFGISTTGFLSIGEIGATVAGTGAIRWDNNNSGIRFRNAGNSADVVLVSSNGSDGFAVGDSTNGGSGTIDVKTGSNVKVRVNATDKLTVDTTGITTPAVQIGSTFASAGNVRVPNATTILAFRNAANSGDKTVFSSDSSNNLFFCNVFPSDSTSVPQLFVCPSSWGYLRIGDSNIMQWNSGTLLGSVPYIGDTSASPWGAHGEVQVAAPNGGTTTLAAGEYCYHMIIVGATFGGSTAGLTGGNVDFPTPAAGSGYTKFVYNGTQNALTLRKAGGGGNTVTHNSGLVCCVFVTSAGVQRVSAGVAYTP